MNTFGTIYRLTTFGESHGPAIGGIVDGVPSGTVIDLDYIQHKLDRRRPGQSSIVTQRKEADTVRLLSGIKDGIALGSPIGFIVENSDQRSADYSEIEHIYRPGHADYTYSVKYGIRDHRGGGRASARETISRVVGGAIAMKALEQSGIRIYAFTSRIGQVSLPDIDTLSDVSVIDNNIVRCPDEAIAAKMIEEIEDCRKNCDSVGGIVTCIVEGCPAGLGEPVFDRLQSRLAAAMMSINAAKGFEYGLGFKVAQSRGSQIVDNFYISDNGDVATRTNFSGGIQGGISNGMPIYMRTAFKPTPTIARELETIDDTMTDCVIKARGRHDPCVVPRAVPIVEAMAAMVIFDAVLLRRANRI